MKRSLLAALVVLTIGACGATTPSDSTGTSLPTPTATPVAPTAAPEAACPDTVRPLASPDPGMTPQTAWYIWPYRDLAERFNRTAPAGLAVATDPAAPLADRLAAVALLEAIEACFSDGLRELELPSELDQPLGALAEFSADLRGQLASATGSADTAALDAALEDILGGYDRVALRSEQFVVALRGWCGCTDGRQPIPAGILPGAIVETPGDLWVGGNAGWSTHATAAEGARYEYDLAVANPWSAYAFDVLVHVWFSPDTTPFGANQAVRLPVVGPRGYTPFRDSASGPLEQNVFIDDIVASVVAVGSWRAPADRVVPAR